MHSKLSVIIAAKNEGETIGSLVQRLRHWRHRPEVIVVANGCRDKTASRAKRAGARVIRFEESLGPDVGRAIGLSVAHGDILLVLDADLDVQLEQLEPFVTAVDRGVDIALNHYPVRKSRRYQHPTAIAKHALNLFANRKDLRACSLTTVPHAISRRALERLGPFAFCVPPVAHVQALMNEELKVQAVTHVHVGRLNKVRNSKHHRMMKQLIIGDCLEAIYTLRLQKGVRGGFTDLTRKRDVIDSVMLVDESLLTPAQTVVVIPAQNESTLAKVVQSVADAKVDRVCIIQNGVESPSKCLCASEQVMIEHFQDALGHDVGRAVGCKRYSAERYFFTDADIPLSKKDVKEYVSALDDADVVLNRLDDILPKRRQVDPPSIVKRFLNIVCERSELGVASLTAIPHAIRRDVIQAIGADSLAVPPLAQVKVHLAGYKIRTIRPVDVIRRNAYRPKSHSLYHGRPVQKLIVGDYLEAVNYLQEQVGVRVYFPDTVRKRDVAYRWMVEHGKIQAEQESSPLPM